MTPEERWKEFEGWFIKGTFPDPEIGHGFIMQIQQAIDEEREACAKAASDWMDGAGEGPFSLTVVGAIRARPFRRRRARITSFGSNCEPRNLND